MSESVFKNPFDVIDDENEVNASKFEIPIEIEQALKKIAKRGCETRSKGFRELLQSLKSLPAEQLAEVAVLLRSSFVSLFKKYVFEPEKLNRAALGEVFRLFVSAADLKNFLAPILKDIIVYWLLAMYDPVKEVSITFRKAFEIAFSGSGAVEKLLDRFKATILEQFLQLLRGEQWDSLKEIAIQVMGANEEEASFVIELVKTELVGLSVLLNDRKILKVDEVVELLIQDKTPSASRRLALYRLYKATASSKLRPKIVKLLALESNPSCLAFSIELLEDLKECLTEPFVTSILTNLPDEYFIKLSLISVGQSDVLLSSIVKYACHGSATVSKERFDCVWKCFCAPKLSSLADEKVISELLFDERKKFRTIGQLNSVDTAERLISLFPKKRIISVLSSKPASCQKALLLHKLDASDDMSECLSQLSLNDLQCPEISAFVEKKHVSNVISGQEVSLKDFVSCLERLDFASASQLLDENTQFSADEILSVASIKLTKNILLTKGDLPFCAKSVAAALELNISVFDAQMVDQVTLEEALSLSTPHWNSPLFQELVEALRIPSLSVVDDLDRLLQNISISPELFVHYNLQDEQYFPIEAFKQPNLEDSRLASILLYKSRQSPNPLLVSLSGFPLKSEANVIIMATWAFIHGITYQATIKTSKTCDNDWINFALFKAGIVGFSGQTKLSSALDIYQNLSAKSISEVNLEFDRLLFPETSTRSVSKEILQIVACLEPLLPLKSDKLAPLIDGSDLSNLIVALHSQRADLNREFWQSQWKEKIGSHLLSTASDQLSKEIALKALGSLWNILESPEEILPTLKDELLQMRPIDSSLFFEQSLSAKLFLLAAPFLQLSKEFLLEKFCKAEGTDDLPWLLALRGSLLMYAMDESLVAAQAKLTAEPSLLEENECSTLIFPLFHLFSQPLSQAKFLILLELFVSWCEGGKEDSMLQAAFHNVFKTKLFDLVTERCSFEVKSNETFDFTPRECDPEELISHLLYRLCAQFPLIMASSCRDVDCSAKLAAREIDRVRRFPSITSENVVIKLKPVLTSTTRVLNLSVNFAGEIDLEIVLHLPKLFPLEPVRVEGIKRSGLKESKWKSAILSLQAIFRSSSFNGNLVEAVRKWQSNALKLFQGLEECSVCYSVVHPSDRSLPGPSCKQCKHRFHASCLYKWFKTSGQATCPLCRALF